MNTLKSLRDFEGVSKFPLGAIEQLLQLKYLDTKGEWEALAIMYQQIAVLKNLTKLFIFKLGELNNEEPK